MKVTDLILDLAKRAGVDVDVKSPALADFLSTTATIPAEIAASLKSGLLSVESAVENESVRSRILAASFGAIDKDVLKKAEELGLEDMLDELKTEKSTRVKVNKLIEKAIEVEKKKAGAGTKGEKAEYEKQLTELNAQIKKQREDFEAEKSSLISQHNDVLINKEIDFLLTGFDYADTTYGKDFVIKYAKDSVLQNLNKNTGKFILENGQLKLVNAKTGGELFDAQNNKLDVKGLVDSSVANLLKKADPTPPQQTEIKLPEGGQKGDTKTADTLRQAASSLEG